MCWVMPPASPSATSVSRTASSSDVLPWSTWPMIVTTGRAVLELVGGVLEDRLGVRLVGGVDDLDLLVELVRDDLDLVVGQRLRERRHLAEAHQLLDQLGDRHGEVLGDVLDRRAGVDPDRVGLQDAGVLRRRLRVGAAAPATAAARRAARRAATGAAARTAGPPGPWRREACESITTRRTPPPEPGARSPCSEERVGRLEPVVVAAALAFGRLVARRRVGLVVGRARGARRRAVEADARVRGRLRRLLLLGAVARRLRLRLAGQRGVGQLGVDGRRGSLDLQAIGLQALHDLARGHVVLLR